MTIHKEFQEFEVRMVRGFRESSLVVIVASPCYGSLEPSWKSSRTELLQLFEEAVPFAVVQVSPMVDRLVDLLFQKSLRKLMWAKSTEGCGAVVEQIVEVAKIARDVKKSQDFRVAKEGADVYVGEVKNGTRHGFGKLTLLNEDIYVGDWVDGLFTGIGIYRCNDTESLNCGDIYIGEWRDGQLHGYGEYYYVSGAVYKGDWKEGILTGNGEIDDGGRDEVRWRACGQ